MVIIIGTSHSIQLKSDKLKYFLEDLCRVHNISAVVEEMNSDTLEERDCSASIPMQVARFLGVLHLFCDPSRAERVRLDILQENDIRAQGFLRNWFEEEVQQRIAESHAKRERYWFDQLRDLDQWPILFICGADHVKSFSLLLEKNGIEVHIAARDWSPEIN